MIHRNFRRLVLTSLLMLIILSVASAFAASITNMPTVRLVETSEVITLSDLAPDECASLQNVLTAVIVCTGGHCDGSGADELILGTAGDDYIDGKNGMDCIVGGAGDDSLNGGNDDDILVGNDGNDTLDGGRKKDTDACYGGSGSNTFTECDLTP